MARGGDRVPGYGFGRLVRGWFWALRRKTHPDAIRQPGDADLTAVLRDPAMLRQFEESGDSWPRRRDPAESSAFHRPREWRPWAEGVVKATETKAGPN